MKATTLLVTVLGAAAAGVAVGLLIAPDKGTETRRKISEKTDDWRSQVNSFIKTGKEYFNDLTGAVSREAEGLEKDIERDVANRYDKVQGEMS